MSKASYHPQMLLVEGTEDSYIFAAFCNEMFGPRSVWVKSLGSDEELLKPENLRLFLLSPQVRRLAVIVDGDYKDAARSAPKNRWTRLRKTLLEMGYPSPPESLAEEGLHLQNVMQPGDAVLPHFSCWVMPDNVSPGYCETLFWSAIDDSHAAFPDKQELEEFLLRLPPTLAKYGSIHYHKAALRTWLAWSEAPDTKTGDAVKSYFHPQDLPRLRKLKAWLKLAFSSAATSD